MSWLARSIANSLRIDGDDEQDLRNANTHNNNNNNGGDLDSSLKPESEEALQSRLNSQSPSSDSASPARGVKDDLSELTKTISGKFWGVASFLSPPPDPSHPQTQISDPDEPSLRSSDQYSDSKQSDDDGAAIAGIRSDFAEIGGKLKSGISQISSNKTVHEITKLASSFLQFGFEEEKPLEEYGGLDGVVGLTEEVVAFARHIAMHPENWLDFPHSDDYDDIDLSDPQQEHALAIERVAPRLAALRMELCPEHISDGCFWKVYFVLVHPRLNKSDADLLSTPQIMEARSVLTKELDERRKETKEPESSARDNDHSKSEDQNLSIPSGSQLESVTQSAPSLVLPNDEKELDERRKETKEPEPSARDNDHSKAEDQNLSIPGGSQLESVTQAAPSLVLPNDEMEKHPVQSTETQMMDKSVVEKSPVNLLSEKNESLVNQTVQSSSVSNNRSVDEVDEDDADDWLKEDDSSEIVGHSGASIATANDEDVSFSDLEEDDGDLPAIHKKATTSGSDGSSTKDS